jgi:hypothetical protein
MGATWVMTPPSRRSERERKSISKGRKWRSGQQRCPPSRYDNAQARVGRLLRPLYGCPNPLAICPRPRIPSWGEGRGGQIITSRPAKWRSGLACLHDPDQDLQEDSREVPGVDRHGKTTGPSLHDQLYFVDCWTRFSQTISGATSGSDGCRQARRSRHPGEDADDHEQLRHHWPCLHPTAKLLALSHARARRRPVSQG